MEVGEEEEQARTWVELAGAENVIVGAVNSVWREVAMSTAWSAISYKTETSDASSQELASTCIAFSQSSTAPSMFCRLRFS